MLVNNTYRDPELKKTLREQVGKPFTLLERIKLGGIGSPKLHITEASLEINNLLLLDNRINSCNIELRPKGILLGFGVRLETYLLVIPFYKLVIYKGKAEEYSIYKDHYFIKFKASKTDTAIHKFVQKIISYKADHGPQSLEYP
ncbi:hypothetical protein [Aquimarina litoralis]|uniref:hypothetical protein n=1 Tax=Aquimarina litoralis TaxID=584605 RepID=UPI001C59D2C3|nr:hypothetical protein [Aquimarina litoralis]MBW1296932.1 hypothetical protein [Aquimarina litoralis]